MHSNGTLKRQKCSIVLVKNTKVFVMAHTYPFNKRHVFKETSLPWSFNLSHSLWYEFFALAEEGFIFDYYDRCDWDTKEQTLGTI